MAEFIFSAFADEAGGGLLHQIEALKAENEALNADYSRIARSVDVITERRAELKEQLQGLMVNATAQREADGNLLILEGWAEADTADKVDALLSTYPNLVYDRRDATIDDIPEVAKIHINSWNFSRRI